MKPPSASLRKPVPAATRPASPLAQATSSPTWMTRGEGRINQTTTKLQQEAQAFGVPRFWVIDGEIKKVRFCSNEPLAAIFQYRVKVRGKWRNVTQPGPGEIDPFADANFLASYRIIFEIIDLTGFQDKNGKQVRNVRRFWEMTPKMWENVQRIRAKYGPITTYNIEVSRTGAGPQTSYTFMPDATKTPMPMSKDKPLAPEFSHYFRPLSESKMRALVGSHSEGEDAG